MNVRNAIRGAAAAAALLAAGTLAAPASAQQASAQQKNAPANASTLTLQGPTGNDVLEITRNPPRQVRAGQEVNYTVDVKNVSEFPVQNVVLKETFQGGFEVVSAEPKGMKKDGSQPSGKKSGMNRPTNRQQGGRQGSKGQFSVNLGTLDGGQTKTVNVTGSAPKEGTVRSCLSADFQPTLCTSFEVVAPNLQLTRKVLIDARAELGEMGMKNAAYTCDAVAVRYTVENVGTGESRGVTLTDDLPRGLVTADGGMNMVEEDLGTLAPGATVTKEYRLTLAEGRETGGTFTLSPARAKSQTDTARAGQDAAPLRVLKPTLDVTIDGPTEQYLDRPAEYTVTVENTSEDPALDTKVTLMPPSGVSEFNVQSQMASGNTVNVGTLKGGESKEFTVSLVGSQPAKVSTTVMASAYCADAAEDTVETQIKGIAAILLEVVDRTDPVPVNSATTYEIYVKNQGSAADSEVALTAELPKEMQFVEATGDSKVTASGNTLTFEKIPTVAPGDVLSWEVKAKATSAAKVRFRVELTSEANQRPVFELEPTTLY